MKRVFGDSAVVNTYRVMREDVVDDTLGEMIECAEAADKNLSAEQQDLSRLSVGHHPRVIRGLAGSGKAVVLANMVSRYLRRRLSELPEIPSTPPPRVGVVCYNRALVPFLTQRISDAFGEDFETLARPLLTIRHLNGFLKGPVEYLHFKEEQDEAVRARDFREKLAILRSANPASYDSQLFDIVFVDEGQDFVPEIFPLLADLVRPYILEGSDKPKKPLIVFYDNAQNVYARPQQFGFNMLYGSQSKEKVKTRTFLDVDTLRKDALITETFDYVDVHFAEREGAVPEVMNFTSRSLEVSWIASQIYRIVEEESVRLSDILVVFRTDYGFTDLPGRVKSKLKPDSINGFVRVYGKQAEKDRYIFREKYLTLSTIHSAKGYDAPIVFLAGVDTLTVSEQDRALFYVAATRAKYRLYFSSTTVRGQQTELVLEAQRVLKRQASRLYKAAGA